MKMWTQDSFHGGENDLLPPSQIDSGELVKVTNLIPGAESSTLKVRGGISTLANLTYNGQPLGEPITGLFRFSRSTTTASEAEYDLASTPTRIFQYDQNGVCTLKHTWATAGRETAFCTMMNTVFMTNGVDTMRAWTGKDAIVPITDRGTTAPKVHRLIYFRGRLWGYNINGSEMYFCGTSEHSDMKEPILPPSQAADQTYYKRWENWSGSYDSDGGFETIGDDDGQRITGIGALFNGIVIFKERSIYLHSYSEMLHPLDPSGANTEVLVPGVGCAGHDTIQYVDGSMLFLGQNARGEYAVYKLLGQGIDEISVKIPNAMQRVIATGTANPRATMFNNYYLLSADDLDAPSGKRTMMYAYDIRRKCWFEITGVTVGSFGFNKERSRLLIGSGTDGRLLEYPVGNTDDGKPIPYFMKTRLLDGSDSMRDWRWRNVILDVVSSAEVIDIAVSNDGGTPVPNTVSYELDSVDYWEDDEYWTGDETAFDGSTWDDGSVWYDGTLEKRLSVPLTGRGNSLQIEVSGESKNRLSIKRIGAAFKPRKVRL